PVGQISHCGNIKRTVVVRRVATTLAVSRIGVHQTGVVASQAAVGVGDGAEPVAGPGTPGQAEFHSVITADGRNGRWAVWAERALQPNCRIVNELPAEYIGEVCTGIADVEAQVVSDSHIFDGPVQPLAAVTSL